MDIGFPSSESVKRNRVFREVDVRAHEFVRSCTWHKPMVSHDLDALLVCCSSDENHFAFRSCCVVQRPFFRHLPSRRRCIIPLLIFRSHGINVLLRLSLHSGEVFKTKSFPHAALPTPVVTFDRCLKSRFAWRHEDRRDAQTQTTSHDFPQRVRPSTSLKNGRVVELGVVGQAEVAPELNELLYRIFRGHPHHRPRSDESAVQRNRVQHLKYFSSRDVQIFDVVELIQLGDFLCEWFQIPACGWWLETFSLPSVDLAVPFQNPVDGCSRRQHGALALLHFTKDRIGAVLSERTVFLKLFSQHQHALFDLRRNTIGRHRRSGGPIVPIDAVEPLPFGTLAPSFDGRFADVKLFRHLTQRLPPPNLLHRRPPILRSQTERFVSYSNSCKKTNCQITTF